MTAAIAVPEEWRVRNGRRQAPAAIEERAVWGSGDWLLGRRYTCDDARGEQAANVESGDQPLKPLGRAVRLLAVFTLLCAHGVQPARSRASVAASTGFVKCQVPSQAQPYSPRLR